MFVGLWCSSGGVGMCVCIDVWAELGWVSLITLYGFVFFCDWLRELHCVCVCWGEGVFVWWRSEWVSVCLLECVYVCGLSLDG